MRAAVTPRQRAAAAQSSELAGLPARSARPRSEDHRIPAEPWLRGRRTMSRGLPSPGSGAGLCTQVTPGGHRGAGGPSCGPSQRELAAEAQTGYVGDGWADNWTDGLEAVAPALKEEILTALLPIEAERMPTAWFHGDLWPGNVFLRRRPQPPVIIDWERARPDAPAGLDAVYAEACRVVAARHCTFGEAVALLARSATRELAPRRWAGSASRTGIDRSNLPFSSPPPFTTRPARTREGPATTGPRAGGS